MMARQSIAQDTSESKRVSFFVNKRTFQILEAMAEQRNMETWKYIKEWVEHHALENRQLVPVMGPEHYTARDNDQDTV